MHYLGRDMKVPSEPIITRPKLEQLYAYYNSPEWIHPDPLEFVYQYHDLQDQELVGLVAASLAYGRVAQILRSVSSVLEKMGPSPYMFVKSATSTSLRRTFHDFKHRFTTGEELVILLLGIRRVIERYGSLYVCFLSGLGDNDETVLPALSFLVNELRSPFNGCSNSLLPLPQKGSACKRLNLFLRWMVRDDEVDPGGWCKVSPSKLVVPLDTHMHRICLLLKLTSRRHADMRTAMEITRAFRKIAPEDPVRYDFALTRLGIRTDADLDKLYEIGVRR
jgi:uncharacterized protein (TIGR02757 family)